MFDLNLPPFCLYLVVVCILIISLSFICFFSLLVPKEVAQSRKLKPPLQCESHHDSEPIGLVGSLLTSAEKLVDNCLEILENVMSSLVAIESFLSRIEDLLTDLEMIIFLSRGIYVKSKEVWKKIKSIYMKVCSIMNKIRSMCDDISKIIDFLYQMIWPSPSDSTQVKEKTEPVAWFGLGLSVRIWMNFKYEQNITYAPKNSDVKAPPVIMKENRMNLSIKVNVKPVICPELPGFVKLIAKYWRRVF